MAKITLDEAIDQFNQIGDIVRARQLVSVALTYALDYMISWEEFEKHCVAVKKRLL